MVRQGQRAPSGWSGQASGILQGSPMPGWKGSQDWSKSGVLGDDLQQVPAGAPGLDGRPPHPLVGLRHPRSREQDLEGAGKPARLLQNPGLHGVPQHFQVAQGPRCPRAGDGQAQRQARLEPR